MEETYYKKVEHINDLGQTIVEYVPVSYYDSEVLHSVPEGDFIISVRPGIRMQRRTINPDYASIQAAVMTLENELAQWILEASERQPAFSVTDNYIKAWRVFKKKVGNENAYLIIDSAQDIAYKFLCRLAEKATEKAEEKDAVYNQNAICVGNIVVLKDDML